MQFVEENLKKKKKSFFQCGCNCQFQEKSLFFFHSLSNKHTVTYIYSALDDFVSFMINSSILVEWNIAAVKPRNVWVQALRHAAQLNVPFHSATAYKPF